ncbi:DUF2953 domain-containing protein [Aquibacillus rhizosphaerae]|uniref:DUF2953 domain-containing protein n=1 Tax=Aquibacillus rhizosphaerae TaxID=3051431 RepID=A0ABT7L7G6_9BACI|nr:DUF2953 domain-containing protein [Aquibacillus sp. LR5S19]MDL4841339.1 DUF2953 domain-containing protein [Aquibacillus sp. LR5S19]
MIWLFIIVIVILLFILILLTKIHTDIHYKYQLNVINTINIKVKIIGITIMSKEIPLLEIDEFQDDTNHNETNDTTSDDFITTLHKYKYIIRRTIESKPILLKHLSKVNIHQIEWRTSFGTGDASVTGLLSGVVWAVKGYIIGLIVNCMNVRTSPKIMVTPLFQQKQSYTELKCIASIRLGQAIYAIIQLARHFRSDFSSLTNETA